MVYTQENSELVTQTIQQSVQDMQIESQFLLSRTNCKKL